MKFSSEWKLKSSRGMTLISALICVALIGIMVLVLASMYETMNKAMKRSTFQREIDNVYKRVSAVIAEKRLCDMALRTTVAGGMGNYVNWPVRTAMQPIPFILQSNGGASTVVASESTAINPISGQPYNQVIEGLFINRIRLRTRDADGNGIPDAPVEVASVEGGVAYTSVPAEVYIEFRGPIDGGGNPLPGTEWISAFKPRVISFVAKISAAGNLERCDYAVSQNRMVICNEQQAILDQGGTPCPPSPCPAANPTQVTVVATLNGYDANGAPKCKCWRICR